MSDKPIPAAPKNTATTKAAESPTPPSEPETTAVEPASSPEWSGDGASGRLRVVVAEDEALIRLDLAEMLVELGYDVVGQAERR
jgi:response regulator NasT